MNMISLIGQSKNNDIICKGSCPLKFNAVSVYYTESGSNIISQISAKRYLSKLLRKKHIVRIQTSLSQHWLDEKHWPIQQPRPTFNMSRKELASRLIRWATFCVKCRSFVPFYFSNHSLLFTCLVHLMNESAGFEPGHVHKDACLINGLHLACM